jgi:glycosyltransferase involved in cell wall biosynthesis
VGIHARLQGGFAGGIESAVIGLAHGLSQLDGDGEEFLFLTYPDDHEWLRPFVSGACRLLPGSPASDRREGLRDRLSRQPALRAVWHRVRPMFGAPALERSDGTVERAGVDVVHFPHPLAFETELPFVYQPYDLQHLHHPEFFTSWVRRGREASYPTFARRASLVAVGASWVRDDLVERYGLDEARIAVVPLAPILEVLGSRPDEERCAAVAGRFRLPGRFLLYPAQTWPHKNHLRLLEALAMLRDRGSDVALVCCGRQNESFPPVEREAHRLGLGDQVRFLGHVGLEELQCLYLLASGLIFPSLFEGVGMPVLEAFAAGLPVACSDVPSLRAYAGDAALLFDPSDAGQIAEAIERLLVDDVLGRALVARGRSRAALFSWVRTARIFRAHYRRIAGVGPSPDDRELLAAASPV